jgi:hypothetical protein
MSNNDNNKDMKLICVICNKKIDDVHPPTQSEIEYIKRAFHIPRGHSGIDVGKKGSEFRGLQSVFPVEHAQRY